MGKSPVPMLNLGNVKPDFEEHNRVAKASLEPNSSEPSPKGSIPKHVAQDSPPDSPAMSVPSEDDYGDSFGSDELEIEAQDYSDSDSDNPYAA